MRIALPNFDRISWKYADIIKLNINQLSPYWIDLKLIFTFFVFAQQLVVFAGYLRTQVFLTAN